jgi:hypothetical protein
MFPKECLGLQEQKSDTDFANDHPSTTPTSLSIVLHLPQLLTATVTNHQSIVSPRIRHTIYHDSNIRIQPQPQQ